MHARKVKILYVITKGNWGGAQRYVFDLVTALRKNRYDYDVSVAVGEGTALRERLAAEGIRVISLPFLVRDVALRADITTLIALIRLFRAEQPDIIHLNSSKAGGLGALAARLCRLLSFFAPKEKRIRAAKIVFTAHGFAFHEDRRPAARALLTLLSLATVLLSHATIVLGKREYASVCAWPGVSKKLILIRNGIRKEDAFRPQAARERLEQACGGSLLGGPLVGTVAELTKNKGLSRLLDAFAQLPDTARLCIIGDGSERNALRERARALGIQARVCFTGFLADAARCLPSFDVFVLSSHKEGLPFALLEAGMHGLPVVATDVGGVGEVITNRANGLLVPPKNVPALAGALRRLLNDVQLRRRLGKALAQTIECSFDFDRTALPATAVLYARLAALRNGASTPLARGRAGNG